MQGTRELSVRVADVGLSVATEMSASQPQHPAGAEDAPAARAYASDLVRWCAYKDLLFGVGSDHGVVKRLSEVAVREPSLVPAGLDALELQELRPRLPVWRRHRRWRRRRRGSHGRRRRGWRRRCHATVHPSGTYARTTTSGRCGHPGGGRLGAPGRSSRLLAEPLEDAFLNFCYLRGPGGLRQGRQRLLRHRLRLPLELILPGHGAAGPTLRRTPVWRAGPPAGRPSPL
mmetsp:Transcript_23066/g.72493  ORF Transcript_23066/g.72493 Transcript_23066/m.72493 type:complete len:230 (-) Transcript_23066:22-711(-)